MPITVGAFARERLVLVNFFRAVTGPPVADAPDIDERGYVAPFRGPLVSIASGHTVRIGLRRLSLEPATALFVESSDTSVVTIADPAGGAVASSPEVILKLTGVDGGTDRRQAEVRVRIGSATGPIIHVLYVMVFKLVTVRMTPHQVTISSASTAGVAPTADVTAIMEKVADIWVHAGVRITVLPVQVKTVVLPVANVMNDHPLPADIRVLFADKWPDGTLNWVPNTINAYFVRQIGSASTLGYGFSRQSFAGFHLPNPGIILGDQSVGGPRTGLMHYANDLAHEVGHFFTLTHSGNKQVPQEREDTWSRRMLMHNFNGMRGHDPWPVNSGSGVPFAERPRFNDAGYGSLARGCMITLKDLPQYTGDGECLAARAAILSTAGPY